MVGEGPITKREERRPFFLRLPNTLSIPLSVSRSSRSLFLQSADVGDDIFDLGVGQLSTNRSRHLAFAILHRRN